MKLEVHLDPEIAEFLAGTPMGSINFGTYALEDLPALRVSMANMPKPEMPPTTTVSRDVEIPNGTGGSDVAVRIYQPPRIDGPLPCLYWIHGGGYIFGSAFQPDARAERWVEQFKCCIVSVEYRLAPEFSYPVPLEDCYAGLRWTVDHADELQIDPGRIVLGGVSAGGGLAAALALLVRDRGDIDLAYQLLIYPMIDDRNVAPTDGDIAPVWSMEANQLGWRAYLGREPGGDDVEAYAAASRATDLSGLPPAFIGVGSVDVFCGENIEYAGRLVEAGVVTELHVYPGAPHGFEMIAAGTRVADQCQRDIDNALRHALRPALSRSTAP